MAGQSHTATVLSEASTIPEKGKIITKSSNFKPLIVDGLGP